MVFGYQRTQNLRFTIPFHLNSHDHWLEQAFKKLTNGTNMYAPPIWAKSCNLWYLATYIWLRRTLIHQLKIHIHVHELEQAFNKLTSKANMYAPPIWANSYILWYSLSE